MGTPCPLHACEWCSLEHNPGERDGAFWSHGTGRYPPPSLLPGFPFPVSWVLTDKQVEREDPSSPDRPTNLPHFFSSSHLTLDYQPPPTTTPRSLPIEDFLLLDISSLLSTLRFEISQDTSELKSYFLSHKQTKCW